MCCDHAALFATLVRGLLIVILALNFILVLSFKDSFEQFL